LSDDAVVVVEQFVRASAATVFSFFAEPRRWLQWQGVEATIDFQPGGIFRMKMAGGTYASGRIVEVAPPQRVVLTWVWEGDEHGVPPGSSTVEIELTPVDDGTLVRLTHRDLPDSAARHDHGDGWTAYLGRLAAVAEGREPARDPMAAGGS
jgi:uncharacterized protein YndB with AHSA1/START domain